MLFDDLQRQNLKKKILKSKCFLQTLFKKTQSGFDHAFGYFLTLLVYHSLISTVRERSVTTFRGL